MSQSYVETKLVEYGISSTPELIESIITQSDILSIPNKALNNLDYVPKRELKIIHDDINSSKELILIILSNLSNTWALAQHSDDFKVQEGYKRLYSKILENQVKYDSNSTSPYRKILDLLIKHKFVEEGAQAYYNPHGIGWAAEYRLTSKYFGKGCQPYQLTTTTVRSMNVRHYKRNLELIMQTHIGMNHIKMLTKVQWPSYELVNATISQAVKKGHTNRDGMRLVTLGKHSKSEYPQGKFIYAEDYLRNFRYLRDNMKMPMIKEEWLQGGILQFRLATCFTLMPKLLRKLITIGGKPIVESDYSALHPNIVQMLYGGSNIEPITHEGVAEYLTLKQGEEISRDIAKKEHLSFFNKKINQMKQSPLWNYYKDKEPQMMHNVLQEKRTHKKGHKATCWEIFAVEVQLMERSIQRLNELGVDVIYVYDALYSIEEEQETVLRVMNEVAQEMNILSRAVIDSKK